MKHLFVLCVLVLSLCFVGCDIDCGPEYQPELRSVVANISTANEENSDPVASDLRLNLSLEVGHIKFAENSHLSFPLIPRAYACSYDPPGFTAKTQIKEISLMCDKSLRGFKAGDNILTTSALVKPTGRYYRDDYDLTLGRWFFAVNSGRIWNGNEFYDISIAFIPEGTVVPADDYTFTFFMELRGGKTFSRTFEPIRIAAL